MNKNNFFYLILCYSLSVLCACTTESQTLFSKVDPSYSGITFENKIEETRESSILQYSNFYGGAGVAVADLDGDGLQDIYFAGNQVADKVYKNLGDLKFEDYTEKAGIIDLGEWSSGVIIGDVNQDGLADIYVTCELYDDQPAKRKNRLYINQGNFRFSEQATSYGLASTERTRGASFIDYDRDGDLDLLMLNQPPNPGNYSDYFGTDLMQDPWSPKLYQNDGEGSFVDVSSAAGIIDHGYANSATVADLNNDGWQDIYIANDYDAPDRLYINNQKGGFENILNSATGHTSYYSMGVDIADINNDLHLDVMVLDMVAEDNYRIKANMGGMEPEAFWKLVDQGKHYQYMYNTLQLNHGNLQFGDIAQLAGVSSTDWSWSNVIADFDNDGWKDIYVTNGLLRDIRNTDMVKKFSNYMISEAQTYAKNNPNAGEVNILDAVDWKKGLDMHPSVPLENYIFKNNADLSFSKKNEDWGLEFSSFSNGCAYGDLDNDGDLDLVVNNINSPAFLFENNASAKGNTNYLRIKLTTESNESIQGSRISIHTSNNKQVYEFTSARGMYSTSENIAHFGLGAETLVDRIEINWHDGTTTVKEKVNANQDLVFTKEKETKQNIHQHNLANKVFNEIPLEGIGVTFKHTENNFDDYSKQILLPHKLSQLGPALATGDINNDGLEDFFLGGASGQSGVIYIQQQDGEFIDVNLDSGIDQVYEDVDAVFVDADNDGYQDLYVVSGGNSFPQRNKSYLDRLYMNDQKGNLIISSNKIPRILESGSVVRPYDFDEDGDEDLFVGARHVPWDYPSPSISRILVNDGGVFTDQTKSIARDLINIGMVTDAVWTDFDEDGSTDIIVVGEWMPITFLKNESGKFVKVDLPVTQNDQIVKTNGWWNSIKAADLDQDGDTDYVIGNLGLNYKYKATQDEPFSVFYDDFDGNNSKDIVLSYYNFGEQYPLRGRSCSSQQIPSLKNDFENYDLFASADLSEVYGEEALDVALGYDAYLFASIVLINNGGGNFEIQELPASAQISSVNGSIVEDFDNDGHLDILIGGNMHHAEVETPRNDASVGLVLTGDKDFQFGSMSPFESGVYLSGDVKRLETIKYKDKKLVIAVRNNGLPSVWEYHKQD